MKRFGLILFLFSLGLIACKKKELTFTIKGTVSDNSFGGGLNGATLILKEISSGNSSVAENIAEIVLPADGTYEITFPRRSAIKYTLSIVKKNYFEIYEEISFSEFSTEEALVKNYGTTAKAWVKIHFVNNTPVVGDELKFIKQQGKEGCSECCPVIERFALTPDTTFYCLNDGNSIYSYYYWATNPVDMGEKSITTVAFDTVEILHNW